jgi:hypothetical protein
VVLVMRSERAPHLPGIGLRVDDVLSVPEVEARRVHEAPAPASAASSTATW